MVVLHLLNKKEEKNDRPYKQYWEREDKLSFRTDSRMASSLKKQRSDFRELIAVAACLAYSFPLGHIAYFVSPPDV